MASSAAVFYFVVPFFRKDRKTFGYMITKLVVVDKDTMKPIEDKRHAIRNFMFIFLNYVGPILLYFWAGGILTAFLPFFFNTLIMCVWKSNAALHDIANRAIVINESLTNEFEILNVIKGGKENEHSISK